MMKSEARADLGAPGLIELLDVDEREFKRKFAGTPISRIKRRGLLRNVCVALGNVGDEGDLAALQKASVEPEPLIAEHAEWAISQIRSRLKNKPEQVMQLVRRQRKLPCGSDPEARQSYRLIP